MIPTLVGAPFSTFTRTMRMAFHHLNVKYKFEQARPHTELANKYNPFGRIPSLLHDGKTIFETSAIRDYIDTKFGDDLTPKDLDIRLKVDQMISVLCDYIFHHVLFTVAKPRERFESEGKPEQGITQSLQGSLKRAGKIIKSVDTMINEQDGPFICGSTLTWADYFVFPVMADLYSLPEGKFFAEQAPKLHNWYKRFENREEVILTYPETSADLRSQKSSLIKKTSLLRYQIL